jgi:hypothetical protein
MAKPPSEPPAIPSPITSPRIKHLAGEGLQRPSKLTAAQVRELAGSVLAHIEPRITNAPPPARPRPPKGGSGKGKRR